VEALSVRLRTPREGTTTWT